MVVINLPAAFDTVNHSILLHPLSGCYGIKGNGHAWLKSYLTDIRQFMTITGERSEDQPKHCYVPQGSVLCPNLYEGHRQLMSATIYKCINTIQNNNIFPICFTSLKPPFILSTCLVSHLATLQI